MPIFKGRKTIKPGEGSADAHAYLAQVSHDNAVATNAQGRRLFSDRGDEPAWDPLANHVPVDGSFPDEDPATGTIGRVDPKAAGYPGNENNPVRRAQMDLLKKARKTGDRRLGEFVQGLMPNNPPTVSGGGYHNAAHPQVPR